MRQQLNSIKKKFEILDWGGQVNSASGSLPAKTITVFLQGRNRSGSNLLSDGKEFVIEENSSLTLTIANTIASDLTDLWRIVVSACESGDPADAVQIAEIKYILDDQVSTINFPVEITFTNPSDIETSLTGMSVATLADLQNQTNAINGQLKLVQELNDLVYAYDANSDSWSPFFFGTQFTNLSNTQDDARGADRLLGDPLYINPLKIDTSASTTQTIPIRYEIVNGEENSGASAYTGQINLRIAVNNSPFDRNNVYYGDRFAGVYKFKILGYRRIANGAINTAIANVGAEMVWDPVRGKINVDTPLLAGWALVVEIWIEVPTINLRQAGYTDGDTLGLNFTVQARTGERTQLTALVGDNKVFAEKAGLRVLNTKLTEGVGIIGGLFFRAPEQPGIFNGALPDSANQVVLVNSAPGGTVRTSPSPAQYLPTEGIRASFSTEYGFSDPGEFSEVFTLESESGLRITVEHPIDNGNGVIRSTYPDLQVRGRTDATWDSPFVRVFLRKGGTTIYQRNTLEPSGTSSSQTIDILNLDDFTPLPNGIASGTGAYGDDFCLWQPRQGSLASLPGGALQPDTWEVTISYVYTSPNYKVTKINHYAAGALTFIELTLDQIFSVFNLWSDQLLTVDSIRQSSSSNYIHGSSHKLSDKGFATYIYLDNITLDDDGHDVIRPIGNGAFIPQPALIQVASQTQLFQARPRIQFGYGLTITENNVSNANLIQVNEAILPAANSIKYMISPSAELYQSPSGEIYTLP